MQALAMQTRRLYFGMISSTAVADPESVADPELSAWERGFHTVLAWTPYGGLVIGLALALVGAGTWPERLPLLVVSTCAALWTWLTFSRAGGARLSQGRLRIHLFGLLLLGAVLVALSGTFTVYLVSAFLHAAMLRPTSLALLAATVTSLLINLRLGGAEMTAAAWWNYGLIVALQASLIGIGIIGWEKIVELGRQRSEAQRALGVALAENAELRRRLG